MTIEPKVNVTLRLKPSTVKVLDELALIRDWRRSDLIRVMMNAGLESDPLYRDPTARAKALAKAEQQVRL